MFAFNLWIKSDQIRNFQPCTFNTSLRKLLCRRNYIHLNLFVTFMLRSLAVFVKDSVLFADKSTDHCTVSSVSLLTRALIL